MRSKSIVLLALALGCGLIASIGISQYMDTRGGGGNQGDRQAVFVAMEDINAGDELTAQNIKLEEWPQAIVPAGALTRLEDVEGKQCRMRIYAGEPILSSKLLGPDESIGAAKDIPPGYRVAHVKIDSSAGSNNLILPGDRVDVLVFRRSAAENLQATASKIVLQDIKVFAVDTQTETEFSRNRSDQTEPITAKTISLLVTPRQAEILHAATEMSGAIRLILRNPDDDTHYVSQGATIGDIFGPDERSDRSSETGQQETGDLTNWLNGQQDDPNNGRMQPAAPALPRPGGSPGKMIVIYGSQLMQVDFPDNGGGPPLNQVESDSFAPGIAPDAQHSDGADQAGAGDAAPSDAPQGAGDTGAGKSIEDEPADPPGAFIEDNPTNTVNE